MNEIPTAQAQMKFIGEDPTGRKWYFADNSFSKPGIYFRDGANNIHVQELIEHQARELTTTCEQLLESESARNRNFQSASEAMETVAKLSAKLETCTLQMEQYSRIMLKALAELANKTANLAHADTKICELQDFIKTQSAELAKVKAERSEAYKLVEKLFGSSDHDHLMLILQDRLDAEEHIPQEEYEGADGIADLVKWMWVDLVEVRVELSRLRTENAAKDAALQKIAQDDEVSSLQSNMSLNPRSIAKSALTTTPPVCVPVEVVAKLVEALMPIQLIVATAPETPSQSDTFERGCPLSKFEVRVMQQVLTLAAPFLAKGDK